MVTKKQPPIQGPAAVFVTTTLRNWTPLFHRDSCAAIMIDCLKRILESDRISCLAYVLMPSHLHLIVGVKDYQLLPAFMHSLKSDSSHLLWSKMSHEVKLSVRPGGVKSIWKPQYDELVITSEKQFRVKMDFIHDNPVKVRIVERATEYEFSSAKDWMTVTNGLIPIEMGWRWAG